MVKTVTKVGNSHAILLDQTIMKLLGLNEKSCVSLTVQGDSLIVTPVHPTADKDAFEAAADRAERKFAGLLTRLA